MNLDEDDIGLLSEYTLTKSQGAKLLDGLHRTAILKGRLLDQDIDFRGILDENLRSEAPDSSFKADGSFKRRGNRQKWGILPCYRSHIGGNCLIRLKEQDVIDWYYNKIEPTLAKKPAVVVAMAKGINKIASHLIKTMTVTEIDKVLIELENVNNELNELGSAA